MTTHDGGPAFSVIDTITASGAVRRSEGITMRDYFAAHAPEPQSYALTSGKPAYPHNDAPSEDYDAYQRAYALWEAKAAAEWAYAFADAMMRARI